jgi:hypothetical protein
MAQANKANPAVTPATKGTQVGGVKAAKGTAAQQAAAPQAKLYKINVLWPVQQNSIRHYAQQVAVALQAANPNGFTLAAYRAALIASAAASNCKQPVKGWAPHNMPTWGAGAKVAWWLPV